MDKTFEKLLAGYKNFRKKHATGQPSVMSQLADKGQHPEVMVIACCDSRVDPAIILQCDPGELFTLRNVANLVPSYQANESHPSVSAALEFGVCFLGVKHLILLGHSQCGGIDAALKPSKVSNTDFLKHWTSLIDSKKDRSYSVEELAKLSLTQSSHNCLTFPWIKQRVDSKQLSIHRWFFDIKQGEVSYYCSEQQAYLPLDKQI